MAAFRFPSGATLAQVKKDAKRIARAEGAPLHRALDIASLRHGICRYAGTWDDVPDEIRGRHEPFLRLPLPTASGLLGVQLSVARRNAYVLGSDTSVKRQVILQALRLALHLGLRRVIWCADGPISSTQGDFPGLWEVLLSEFPGRVQRCALSEVAAFRLSAGSLVVIDDGYPGDLPAGVPASVALIRFLPEGTAPDDDRLAFTLTRWPGEPEQSLRFLLSEADGRAHFVDFERWQGWLDQAVELCVTRGICDLEDVARRWGGQSSLSFLPAPAALVSEDQWADYESWMQAEGVSSGKGALLSPESLATQQRFLSRASDA